MIYGLLGNVGGLRWAAKSAVSLRDANPSLTPLFIPTFGRGADTLTTKQQTSKTEQSFWPNKSVDAKGAKWRHYLCKHH